MVLGRFWEGLGTVLGGFWRGLGAFWVLLGITVFCGLFWAMLGFAGVITNVFRDEKKTTDKMIDVNFNGPRNNIYHFIG